MAMLRVWFATVVLCALVTFAHLQQAHAQSTIANISVDGTQALHVTDKRYLSFGMDSNTVRNHWVKFDFKSTRLKTLAKGLAPAYLRLSGTDGDRMLFNATDDELTFPSTTFSMSAADWDNINRWCADVDWDLMFGLNNQLRYTMTNVSYWDPRNAMKLLSYSVLQGYNQRLHFQLGNEPDRYVLRGWATILTGGQIASDFYALRKILQTMFAGYFDQSVIIGPDISVTDGRGAEILRDFLSHLEPEIVQAVDFHNYLGGNSSIMSFVDPDRLDTYTTVVENIQHTVSQSKYPDMPVWNSETGVSGGNTATGYETKFAATFQLVEHLGTSAKLKLAVCTRQTFYGLWLGLIDDNLEPYPPYWFALLFKRLVDREVLQVSVAGLPAQQNQLRLFAHCTSRAHVTGSRLPRGAITVYGMNLFRDDMVLNFGPVNVELYLLTSDSLKSDVMRLNGVPLRLHTDDALPLLLPVRVRGTSVVLPPYSVALVVIPDAGAAACA